MFSVKQSTEELTQNLIDAGCSEDIIESFLSCLMNGDKEESLCRLQEQRSELLEEIHKDKSCIELLDELILKLRRSNDPV